MEEIYWMESMTKWFIYAYPASYGGLHGMYDWEIVENISKKEAEEEGFALAHEVIENYQIFDENFWVSDYRNECNIPEDQDINWDDFYDYMEPMIVEECAYEVYELKPTVNIEDVYHDNLEPKELIKKYCLI